MIILLLLLEAEAEGEAGVEQTYSVLCLLRYYGCVVDVE